MRKAARLTELPFTRKQNQAGYFCAVRAHDANSLRFLIPNPLRKVRKFALTLSLGDLP